MQMRIGTMAAARAAPGLRPAGIGVGPWRPAEPIAIGHANLLVVTALAWGTAKRAEGTPPWLHDWPLTLSRAGAKVTWRPANGPATASWRIRHTGGSLGGLPRTRRRSVHASQNLSPPGEGSGPARRGHVAGDRSGMLTRTKGGLGCNLGRGPTPCRIVHRGPGKHVGPA